MTRKFNDFTVNLRFEEATHALWAARPKPPLPHKHLQPSVTAQATSLAE